MRHTVLVFVAACTVSARPTPDAATTYQPEADADVPAPASQSDGTCAYEQEPCGAACSRMGLCYVVTPSCQCACYKC